jgi:hypothetical protein
MVLYNRDLCGPQLDEPMPRLDKARVRQLKNDLAQWLPPAEALEIVQQAMELLGSVDLFNQGGLDFIRDAWIMGDFGQTRGAGRVRIILDSWPDFELWIDDRVEQYEAVEADDPRRRRGHEYRTRQGELLHDPVENWVARAEDAPSWVESACRRKVNKCYAQKTNLVVYLNMNEFGIRQDEVENAFPRATAVAKDNFDCVWVLWKNRTYLTWKAGVEQY